MPLPAPAGAAANKAKLVVTLILCSPLPANAADVQGTGNSARREPAKQFCLRESSWPPGASGTGYGT